MKLTDFLIDLGNSVAYYPKLVEVTGGVLPNLFLCQMYYWLGKQKNPEGWIYKTQAEIEKETGLTRKQQETARKFLKARGLLQEKYTGCPRRLEFWLDKDALNQRWSAFMNNLELPIAKITSSWTRRAKKSQDDADQKPSRMPNSDNIDSTNSAICNALTEQYILPQSSSTECPDSTGYNAFLGHTVMPSSDNLSIYTKNTSKITSEITTHNAPPNQNALPIQKSCVCETEQLNLEKPIPEKPTLEESIPEEPTPQQPTSLLKKSESSQQTDNPSRGSTIAGGSFEKSEQSNKPQLTCPYKTARNVKELIDAWLTDPTAMSDDSLPLLVRETIKWNCWVLPWRNGERKLNNLYQNFNPIVVDFLAQELATKSKRSARQEIDHAIAVMNTWEKTKGGWTNLMQRYHQALQTEKQQPLPQLHTALAHRVKNTTSSSLEDALAQDHKRRQQEQSIRVPSNEYQHSPQMLELKAKLQAKANEPKVPSNTRPSSTNLREVEAQLKLALRA